MSEHFIVSARFSNSIARLTAPDKEEATGYTKMLMKVYLAALRMTLLVTLAVFFSPVAQVESFNLTRLEGDMSELVYSLSRSIVTVESSTRVESDYLSGAGEEAIHSLISSGIIYDTLGHILVDASSVAGRDRIAVRFENYIIPAELVGIDYQTGLAIIKVSVKVGQPANLSKQFVCAGKMVIAIGNAFGLPSSPSLGFCAGARDDGTMQFSVPITSGTIGGGLFDLSGRLIGVITGGMNQQGSNETGLAVPAILIPSMARHLISCGDRQAGYLGITSSEIEIIPPMEIRSPAMFASDGSASVFALNRALMVLTVVAGSPAAAVGLAKGDLLFSINGEPITSVITLMKQINQTKPGSQVRLGLLRQDGPIEIAVKIGQRRLGSFSSRLTPVARNVSNSNVSLQREIEQLKVRLKLLEYQLKSIK